MTKRTRDWRRAKARLHDGRTPKRVFRAPCEEKQWRNLYFRSAKHQRAKKLGRFWPPQQWERLMADATQTNILFVCSMNEWRSPTGEAVFKRVPGLNVRSAGTVRGARRTLSVADIRWADVIFVMEEKHKSRMRAQFRDEARYKQVHVLDIPDEYRFMDDELVDLLKAKVEPLLGI